MLVRRARRRRASGTHDKSLPSGASHTAALRCRQLAITTVTTRGHGQLLNFLETTQPKLRRGIEPFGGRPVASPFEFLDRCGRDCQAWSRGRAPRKVSSTGRFMDLFYGTPTPNAKAATLHAANIFSVTRQLRYSKTTPNQSAGPLPVHQWPAGRHVRAEKQADQTATVEDAIQYKRDRRLQNRFSSAVALVPLCCG